MQILGIDPGPEQSGYALLELEPLWVFHSGEAGNEELLELMRSMAPTTCLALEGVGYHGEHTGRSVMLTCEWIGRFTQAFLELGGRRFEKIERAAVSLHFTGQRASRKSAVHDAVRSRFYPTGEVGKVKGTKKQPGPCYGVSGDHVWDAVGVAVALAERRGLLGSPPGELPAGPRELGGWPADTARH